MKPAFQGHLENSALCFSCDFLGSVTFRMPLHIAKVRTLSLCMLGTRGRFDGGNSMALLTWINVLESW